LAGIYIHIPFCKKACNYCDFHFSTTLKNQDNVINAICKEIVLRKDYIGVEPIETIYFGGGTPSLLTADQLKLILKTIQNNFEISLSPEITLEANPDDLSKEKLAILKAARINRLSIGVQSFFEEHLSWMNRAHNAKESLQCLQWAKEVGFDNITIDLIYGIPQMTDAQWEENIDTALSLNIPHISAYNLTVEEKTVLAHQIKKGTSESLSDSQGERNFLVLQEKLKAANFVHYEISNFGQQAFFSKHNTSYWQGKKYLGVGPSAHSFDRKSRAWNIANNALYLKGLEAEKVPLTSETLSSKDLVNEHLMIGLRNIWGCAWEYLENCGEDLTTLKIQVTALIEDGKLVATPSGFKTTTEGLLFADGIASELFLD
jgi:oxygen-independent coproporphyrinogen-3 oxidase